jgi:hypothetical protein
MNRINKIAWFLISILIFIVLGLEIILSGERPTYEFSSFEGVKASGLIEKGWIPPFIPDSSFNIHSQHDLDTNIVTMSFEYEVNDKEKTRSACNSERSIENGIEFKCTYRFSDVTINLLNNGSATLGSLLAK